MRDVPSRPLAAPAIAFPKDAVADLCRRFLVRKLAVFGSVIRTDFAPESDVDVLVEFAPEARVGYFRLAELQLALEDLIGRRVDLHTPASLSPHIRGDVAAHAQTIYAVAG